MPKATGPAIAAADEPSVVTDTPPQRRWRARAVEAGALTFWLAAPVAGALGLADAMTSDRVLVDDGGDLVHPLAAVLLILVAGVLLMGLHFGSLASPGSDRWEYVALLASLAVLATVLLIVGAAAAGQAAAQRGVDLARGSDELTVGQVHQHLAWELADTLPLIDVPATIGWERPVDDPAPALGGTALVVKLTFLVIVVDAGRRALTALRKRPQAAPGGSASTGSAEPVPSPHGRAP